MRQVSPTTPSALSPVWLGLWLIARIYATLRHRPGLGAGDANLMAAAGAWAA